MAIKRVEIKDYLVFKGEFATDFSPTDGSKGGVNVVIGGNATGKTTLLRCLYELKDRNIMMSNAKHEDIPHATHTLHIEKSIGERQRNWGRAFIDNRVKHFVYIPEKDILEHAKGLLPFIEEKQTGFDLVYKDVLLLAQDVPTQKQSEVQKFIGEQIADIIGGAVEWNQGDGAFYTIKTDGSRIPFANEASGHKKFGFLGLLTAIGKLEEGSVLFWDEPENSLNPELVPKLVDILLELSRNGVQIFIATHSELLADYFDTIRKDDDEVMFASLYKDGEIIRVDTSDRFDLLRPNKLMEEPVRLYEKKLDRRFGEVE